MRLFRRKKQGNFSADAEMKKVTEVSRALAEESRALAEVARANPEYFDGPLEDELIFPKSVQPPLPVATLEHICSSSAERVRETDADPLFAGWAEAAAKSAAIALMRVLDYPGHLLGATILSEASARRAMSVIAALFSYSSYANLTERLQRSGASGERLRATIGAIDPLGGSLFGWLSWRAEEIGRARGLLVGGGIRAGFWTVDALVIALMFPNVQEIPVEADLQALVLPLPSPVPATFNMGDQLVVYSTVSLVFATNFIPRLDRLLLADSTTMTQHDKTTTEAEILLLTQQLDEASISLAMGASAYLQAHRQEITPQRQTDMPFANMVIAGVAFSQMVAAMQALPFTDDDVDLIATYEQCLKLESTFWR